MNTSRSEWTGFLSIEIENRAGKSVPKDVYFHDALKVQRPIYHGNVGMPCYYILNVGGGYMDGDTYRIEVRLRENAKLTLTTLGATLIYKTPNKTVYQETEISLEKDSYLEYLPDPLIAYRNARYFQKDTVHMKKTSTLLLSDIITPGWSPEGENFSYGMVRIKTQIYMEEELIFFDHVKLQPDAQRFDALGFMEDYTHLGTFIVIDQKIDDDLINRLYETILEQQGDFKAGISRLSVPGFTIRVMGKMTQEIERIFSACRQLIHQVWFEEKPSFLRKY